MKYGQDCPVRAALFHTNMASLHIHPINADIQPRFNAGRHFIATTATFHCEKNMLYTV